MSAAQAEPVRATVAVVGGFILAVVAIAVEIVPLIGLAVAAGSCAQSLLGIAALPFAAVGAVLALGSAYLAVLGRGSAHVVVVLALFTVGLAGAVTIVVVATGGASSPALSTCFVSSADHLGSKRDHAPPFLVL